MIPSERIQRRVDRLLDKAEEAADARDWTEVEQIAREAVTLDPENSDATALINSARSMLSGANPTLPLGESLPSARDGDSGPDLSLSKHDEEGQPEDGSRLPPLPADEGREPILRLSQEPIWAWRGAVGISP